MISTSTPAVTAAAHAVDARDAVVDGDDQARRAARRELDDLRREAVAVLEPVRDQEIDVGADAARPRTPTAHAVAPSAS